MPELSSEEQQKCQHDFPFRGVVSSDQICSKCGFKQLKLTGLQSSKERGGWNAFGTRYIGGSGNPYD